MDFIVPIKNLKQQERKRGQLNLVDLLLRVCQQVWEVREDVTVEDHLRLLVRPGDDVAHRPQSRRLQQ